MVVPRWFERAVLTSSLEASRVGPSSGLGLLSPAKQSLQALLCVLAISAVSVASTAEHQHHDHQHGNVAAPILPQGEYSTVAATDDGAQDTDTVTIRAEWASNEATMIAEGSVWRYLDNGSNQGTAWRAKSFNDSGWALGPAQLGYGDGDEATVISYGSNSANKYVTAYFRHSFTVADASGVSGLIMRLMDDDGSVVYLNGTEVARNNLPSGAIVYDTYALSAVGSSTESSYDSYIVDPELLIDGANVIAVEIHQANPDSSDKSFDLELVATSLSTITRGPYLQLATPTSMTVRWRTLADTDTVLRYGTAANALNQAVTIAGSRTDHEVTITGLLPDTHYFYGVGNSNGLVALGEDHSFTTFPAAGDTSARRIWVIGDSGTANSNAQAVYNSYRSWTGGTNTDLWLMLGDNAYNDGTDAEYQRAVFDMYPELLRQVPLFSCLGNHDGYTADSATETGPYYDIFTLPRAAEAGGLASGTEAYYSFDFGNVHFVCLDSYETSRSVGGAMYNWLESDLQATTQPWIVAFWHHPPYTKGSHDSDTQSKLIQMRENFLPLLESYGVDLVLSGHSHSYERSRLIDGHYGMSSTFSHAAHSKNSGDGDVSGNGGYVKPTEGLAANEGAVYITAGSSGKISGGSLNHPAMVRSLNILGSVVIDVDDLVMDVTFLDNVGAAQDSFQIKKGDGSSDDSEAPTVPSDPTATAVSASAIDLSWTASSDNVGVDHYVVRRDGAVIASNVTGTSFSDAGLAASTTYGYTVQAVDSAGNASAQTARVEATTHSVSSDAVLINFQPADAPTVDGYLVDAGDAFGNRGNGQSYGWNADVFQTRDRNTLDDQLLDTLNHAQYKGNTYTWELAVANGDYEVRLVCSDPRNANMIHDWVIEDQAVTDPDGLDGLDEFTVTVTVADGRLTIMPAATAENAKISVVEVRPVAVASVAINFQPADAPTVDGYFVDAGDAFADRGNGQSYGWNTNVFQTRDRNRIDDQLLDTLNHAQYRGNTYSWELAVANGDYEVVLSCGDSAHANMLQDWVIEGQTVYDLDGLDNFDVFTVTVSVTDGRLTLVPAVTAENAKINYVEVRSLTDPDSDIWLEDFADLSAGVQRDSGETAWRTDVSNLGTSASFGVSAGAFRANHTGGVGLWKTEQIDIAGQSGVEVSVDIQSQGPMENKDYIEVSYRIDSGSEVMIARRANNFNSDEVETIGAVVGSGTSVQIIIRAKSSASDETHVWDNVTVSGSSSHEGEPVLVNFQPADAPTVDGYLIDAGDAFGDRGNGQSYGWNVNNFRARDRGSLEDQLLDTLNHAQYRSNTYTWELAVPNGDYEVVLTCSDPQHANMIQDWDIEGQTVNDPDGLDSLDIFTVTVSVTDGRLTLTPAATAENAKISVVEVRPRVAAALGTDK